MKVVTLPQPGPFNESSDSDSVSTTSPPNKNPTTPQGSLTLMDKTGLPFGFINASETTAFRTALASSLLITPRTKVKTITGIRCWQAGILAYPTRPHTSRSHYKTTFFEIPTATKEREGWSDAKFTVLSPAYGEFARLEKDYIRASDIIFCTTPSTSPLFPHSILTNTEGRRKGRLIVAIGSYKPDMIEIPVEVIAQAVKIHDGCKHEAGEIIQGNVSAKNLVELGELVMLSHGSDPLDHSSAFDDSDESPRNSFDLSNLKLNRNENENNSATPTPTSPPLPRSMSNVYNSEHSVSPSSSRPPSRGSSFFRKPKSRTGSTSTSATGSSGTLGMLGKENTDGKGRWYE
ncbi:hypothetical protein DID88_000838 [Monilinia fructigena]|uniref:Uncharacterized protein n=1 Tax=Monilinia fructigena TaxID=38457 RepID=A0A395IL19_9HELO|nr:hypothetical protein DID88_000838 [Monilinia fructigena]